MLFIYFLLDLKNNNLIKKIIELFMIMNEKLINISLNYHYY